MRMHQAGFCDVHGARHGFEPDAHNVRHSGFGRPKVAFFAMKWR